MLQVKVDIVWQAEAKQHEARIIALKEHAVAFRFLMLVEARGADCDEYDKQFEVSNTDTCNSQDITAHRLEPSSATNVKCHY